MSRRETPHGSRPEQERTDRDVRRSFFETLNTGRYGTWLKRALAFAVLAGAFSRRRDLVVHASNVAWDAGIAAHFANEQRETRVEDFEQLGYRPEHVREALNLLFGAQDIERNIRSVRYQTQSIPPPFTSTLNENAGGVCKAAPGRMPAEIIIPPEGLGPVENRTKNLLDGFAHEGAHAILDIYNSGDISSEVAEELDTLLDETILEAGLYDYAESYSGTLNRVLGMRRAEFLAELTRDMASLPEDPVLIAQIPNWHERTRVQLERGHPRARPEAIEKLLRVIDCIERWKGSGYWERMQQGYRAARQLLEQDQFEYRLTARRETDLNEFRRQSAAHPDPRFIRLLSEEFQRQPPAPTTVHPPIEEKTTTHHRHSERRRRHERDSSTSTSTETLPREQRAELERLARGLHHAGFRAIFLRFAPLFAQDVKQVRVWLNARDRAEDHTCALEETLRHLGDVDAMVRYERHRTIPNLEAFYQALGAYIRFAAQR